MNESTEFKILELLKKISAFCVITSSEYSTMVNKAEQFTAEYGKGYAKTTTDLYKKFVVLCKKLGFQEVKDIIVTNNLNRPLQYIMTLKEPDKTGLLNEAEALIEEVIEHSKRKYTLNQALVEPNLGLLAKEIEKILADAKRFFVTHIGIKETDFTSEEDESIKDFGDVFVSKDLNKLQNFIELISSRKIAFWNSPEFKTEFLKSLLRSPHSMEYFRLLEPKLDQAAYHLFQEKAVQPVDIEEMTEENGAKCTALLLVEECKNTINSLQEIQGLFAQIGEEAEKIFNQRQELAEKAQFSYQSLLLTALTFKLIRARMLLEAYKQEQDIQNYENSNLAFKNIHASLSNAEKSIGNIAIEGKKEEMEENDPFEHLSERVATARKQRNVGRIKLAKTNLLAEYKLSQQATREIEQENSASFHSVMKADNVASVIEIRAKIAYYRTIAMGNELSTENLINLYKDYSRRLNDAIGLLQRSEKFMAIPMETLQQELIEAEESVKDEARLSNPKL